MLPPIASKQTIEKRGSDGEARLRWRREAAMEKRGCDGDERQRWRSEAASKRTMEEPSLELRYLEGEKQWGEQISNELSKVEALFYPQSSKRRWTFARRRRRLFKVRAQRSREERGVRAQRREERRGSAEREGAQERTKFVSRRRCRRSIRSEFKFARNEADPMARDRTRSTITVQGGADRRLGRRERREERRGARERERRGAERRGAGALRDEGAERRGSAERRECREERRGSGETREHGETIDDGARRDREER
ncbi:hypothetical protein Syun_021264 [Stephania yunnanensis]|uniref:Uncharacterized protein n=1 Tax=Stephania yunnanensis TaxID=152371 RepID=A0AAP0IHB0_9MAGN